MELSKVQKIIDLLSYDDDFHLWNIKTKITTIVDTFVNNYYLIRSEERKNFIEVNEKNKQYKLSCNDHMITPSSKGVEYVSKSAMRQYIDVLTLFNVIEESKVHKGIYDIINNKILNKEEDVDSLDLFEDILYGIKTNPNHQAKKVVYSCLITYLVDFCDENDKVIVKIRGSKTESLSVGQVKKIASDCGYNFFIDKVATLGKNLDQIYSNLLSLITS